MTVLEITRAKTYVAMLVPYRVFVDDVEIGKIANGSTGTFEVSPGLHTVQIKQGRMVRSNTLSIDCLPNASTRLQVTQNGLLRQFLLRYTGKRLAEVTNMTLERLP